MGAKGGGGERANHHSPEGEDKTDVKPEAPRKTQRVPAAQVTSPGNASRE